MKYSEISKINSEAKRCIDNKEFDKVVELVQPIIDYDKFNNPYAFMLLLLAEAKGDYEDVLDKCNSFIKQDKELYFYYIVRANVFDEIKEYEKALLDSDKAIKINSNYTYAYYLKGNFYNDLKEYDKALEWFEKAIELDSEYVPAFNGKGIAYEYMEKYDKALLNYDKAIELDTNFSWAYRNKGDVYFELKNYDNVIKNYQKAIDLDKEKFKWLESKINRAKTELEEQKKNADNKDRDKISNVIDDIKETLEYTGEQVCHYTTTSVLKELCNASKLRFSHVGLVNDPTEGKTLYNFLEVDAIERTELSGFIGSFVESQNNDFLPLWRAYGRDGEGVSICLDAKILTQNAVEKDNIETLGKNISDSKIETRKLYKIAYINEKGDIYLDGQKNAVLKRDLKKLKKVLDPLISNVNIPDEETLEPLVEIQYLFKNAIYMVEREVRYYDLWKNNNPMIKWDLNLSPPTTFIEVNNDIRNHIHNVTLGPKAKNATTWMALYKTMLAREGNKDVSVTQSKIPYR